MNELSLKPLIPELTLLGFACLVLILDLYSSDREKRSCYSIAQIGFFVVFLVLVGQLGTTKQIHYYGTYVIDNLSVLLKLAIVAISSLSLVYARVFIKGRRFLRGEYFALCLFAVLGMMVMVSAYSLLTVYLGLELLSLTLYALIAMQRDGRRSPEAAIKYFVTGAIASGFLLYGMSLLYGVTGQLQLASIYQALVSGGDNIMLARFAVMFFVAGIAFKLGLVPFHMWIPDVYHGAPTSVTAFLASVPKIAGYGLAIRLLIEGMQPLLSDWSQMLLITALLSIAFGNIIAIAQTNFKRLLAYSGIAHMEYFALGLYAGEHGGYQASMYYVLVYAFMTLAGFGLLVFMSRIGYECDSLDDFKGLAKQNAWYALMLTLVMLSMAGIPPLIGFWPKLEIFRALIAAGHINIAIFAIVFSVIGLFYYLRVIKVVFFDDAEKDFLFIPSRSIRFAITFHCLGMLVLGISPETVYRYCIMAFT